MIEKIVQQNIQDPFYHKDLDYCYFFYLRLILNIS